MQIRILYFDGCPNHEPTVRRVRSVARMHGVEDRVKTLEVASDSDAVAERFLGSPTVQIDGVDIDPSARDKTDSLMGCRLYGESGVPSESMIDAAIREARG